MYSRLSSRDRATDGSRGSLAILLTAVLLLLLPLLPAELLASLAGAEALVLHPLRALLIALALHSLRALEALTLLQAFRALGSPVEPWKPC